jgi:hypothetical protein
MEGVRAGGRGRIGLRLPRELVGLAQPQVINDAPAGDEAQSVLERTALPVKAPVAHLPGQGDDSFLYEIVRLRDGQAGLDGLGLDAFQ